MLKNYSFDTSFGEICLGDLTDPEWEDICEIADSLMENDRIEYFYQAVICAFIIWISEKEIMEKPKTRWDKTH